MTDKGDDNINKKQKKAAELFIETGDGYSALINAGYSEKFAATYKAFFDRKEIKEYIQQYITEEDCGAKSDEVIRYLFRVMRGEEKETELVKNKNEKGETVYDAVESPMSGTLRMKAAELLCKRYGLYREKAEANINIPVVIKEDI